MAITDVVKIEDEFTFLRPIYAGNAFAKVTMKKQPQFISLRLSNFDQIKLNGKDN